MGFFGFELDRDWFDPRAYKTSIFDDDDYIDYHGYRLPGPINLVQDLNAVMSDMATVMRELFGHLETNTEEELIIEEDIDGNIIMIDGDGLIKEIKP